jgi:hypothetical protein
MLGATTGGAKEDEMQVIKGEFPGDAQGLADLIRACYYRDRQRTQQTFVVSRVTRPMLTESIEDYAIRQNDLGWWTLGLRWEEGIGLTRVMFCSFAPTRILARAIVQIVDARYLNSPAWDRGHEEWSPSRN